MNNLLSYCGLVDAKIRASDIGLPVFNIYQTAIGCYDLVRILYIIFILFFAFQNVILWNNEAYILSSRVWFSNMSGHVC